MAHRLILLLSLEKIVFEQVLATPKVGEFIRFLFCALWYGREGIGAVPYQNAIIQNTEKYFFREMFALAVAPSPETRELVLDETVLGRKMLSLSAYRGWIRFKLKEATCCLREILIRLAPERLRQADPPGESINDMLTRITDDSTPINGQRGRLAAVIRIRDLLHTAVDLSALGLPGHKGRDATRIAPCIAPEASNAKNKRGRPTKNTSDKIGIVVAKIHKLGLANVYRPSWQGFCRNYKEDLPDNTKPDTLRKRYERTHPRSP
jgi:hypothetical protein